MNFSGDKVYPEPLSGSEVCECTEGMENTTERGPGQRFLSALVIINHDSLLDFITQCWCCSRFLCLLSLLMLDTDLPPFMWRSEVNRKGGSLLGDCFLVDKYNKIQIQIIPCPSNLSWQSQTILFSKDVVDLLIAVSVFDLLPHDFIK